MALIKLLFFANKLCTWICHEYMVQIFIPPRKASITV